METTDFDSLTRACAGMGTRRQLVGLLAMLPLGGLVSRLTLLTEVEARARPRRHGHRRHSRHDHHQAQARRQDRHQDTSSEACIPTGQHCPSSKPRGKKRKKLGCDKCCQGSFLTEASGKKVCGCRPNGRSCTPDIASSCCSGFCDGVTCQAAPCSAAIPCPACQSCNAATGLCEALANGTTCDDGTSCAAGTCQRGVCTSCATPPVCHTTTGATCNASTGQCEYPTEPDGTSCGGGNVCCGGACVECCNTSHCPSGQSCLLEFICQACDVLCTGTPSECGSALQAELNAGGTIYVCPGTYQPTSAAGFTPPIGGCTLIGAGEGTNASSNTVLDANHAGRVLLINSGVGPVELQRLRLTGGNDSSVSGGGGGISHGGTTLHMTECTVADNTAVNRAGGLDLDSGQTLEMTRCTVRNNHATRNDSFGGGIFTRGTTTLTNCLVEANSAGIGGGGIFTGVTATLTLTNCLVVANSGDNVGGGISTGGTTNLTDCSVENNSAAEFGGGISVIAGTITLAGTTTVQFNHADATPLSGGGGILVSSPGTLIIEDTCQVTHNTATAGRGGGVWNTGGAVTLQGAHPEQIVVDNCHENCVGTVPGCTNTRISCP